MAPITLEAFTTPDGRQLAYSVRGSGPLLVCHAGGPGYSGRYFEDVGGLDRHFTVVAPDPRGTGRSSRPARPDDYHPDSYVEDLELLREHLGAESFHLLGHSFGGTVAAMYASRHPERVDRLVILHSLLAFLTEYEPVMDAQLESRADEPWYAEAREALDQDVDGGFTTDEELADVARRSLPFYFGELSPEVLAFLNREDERADGMTADAYVTFRQLVETEGFDVREEAQAVTAATLVLTGTRDWICGPVCAGDILAAIPAAEYVELPDIGHMSFVEDPAAFRAAVLPFLQGDATARRAA